MQEVLELQALDAQGPPAVLGWDSSTHFIDEAIQRVLLKGASPKDELAIAAREMNKLIE